jgi:lysophospholipase L1-like esterase
MERNSQQNLGLHAVQKIKWHGIRGLKWERLMAEVQFLAIHNQAPKIIIIHAGSNDLCSAKCSTMRQSFRSDIDELHSLFPNAKICMSAMLPRMLWPQSFPLNKIEKKRKLLNRFIRRLTTYVGGLFINHEEISTDTPGFYFSDGVHLSSIGCDMFLLAVKDALEHMLT